MHIFAFKLILTPVLIGAALGGRGRRLAGRSPIDVRAGGAVHRARPGRDVRGHRLATPDPLR